MQTSQQEKVEARWATSGFGRTRGSADPVVGLLVLPFVVSRVCVAFLGCAFPHTCFCTYDFAQDIWKQKEPCRFESRGVQTLLNSNGGTLHCKGNWKNKIEREIKCAQKITRKGDGASYSLPFSTSFAKCCILEERPRRRVSYSSLREASPWLSSATWSLNFLCSLHISMIVLSS
jgi:hypothetical protein